MSRLLPRLALGLAALLVAACAAAGALWYFRGRSDEPPPPPSLANLPLTPAAEGPADPGPSLTEAQRAYVWELEHHGNVLNMHGFKRLANALRDADAKALTAMLANDFAGQLPQDPHVTSLQSECVDVVRREDAGRTPARVGREQFLAALLGFRRNFTAKPPGVQLVLKTARPRIEGQLDGPWEGLAQLRLHGDSSPGQPCEITVLLDYETVRPTQEGLARPGWLRAARVRQSLVAQAKHYLLAEVTRERGLDPSLFHDNWLEDQESSSSQWTATGGVFVCDFDRDGILDVLVTDLKRYALYRGGPDGHFVDVTAQVGLPILPLNETALSGVACWIDIDGDGWDDLILGGRVFRNLQGKRFVDYTARSRLRLPPDTISLVVADYDRDGKLDLYATRTGSGTARSWLDGRSARDAGNRLFRNQGDWQFEDVTERSGTSGGQRSTFTAVWLDANNDGWPDLYVTNEFGNGLLLENRGDGTFRERALGQGDLDFGTMGAAAGDIDNDGHIDIYAANMYSKAGNRVISNIPPGTYPAELMSKLRRFVAGSQMHLNKGDFRFRQAGADLQVNGVGWAYGPVLADLDNDGWLDIFATAGHMSRDRNKPDG
jgi:hypothetical protein